MAPVFCLIWLICRNKCDITYLMTIFENRADGDYNDEYDDTYDDVQKEDDFDPYALSQARTRERITRERTIPQTLTDNPNIPKASDL